MGLVLSTVHYIFGTGQEMDTPDKATGLTEREKAAIRDSWTLVNTDLQGNGVSFIIKFITDFPDDKSYFPAFKDKDPESLRNDPKMRSHGLMVMHALTAVVDNLDDPDGLVDLLKKNAHSHYERHVRVQQYKDLFSTYIKFLEEELGEKCTDLTTESWKKALNVVTSVIAGEMNEIEAAK